MKIRYFIVLPLLLPLAAWSQPDSNGGTQTAYHPAPMTPDAFGNQAREWLDLQASGRQSAQTTPPLPGDVAGHIYQRYLKSFDHAIPDQYQREKFVQGGGGGS